MSPAFVYYIFTFLQVDVYGDRLPLKACGSVSVRESQLLVITVFDEDVSVFDF